MTATAAPLHTKTNQNANEMVVRRLVINSKVVSPEYIINIGKIIEKTKGALSTTYGNDLVSQLNKVIQKYTLSKEQDQILRNLTEKLIEIEKLNKTAFNLNFDQATDEEIIISRKNEEGLGILSVDPYGTIMVHFSWYIDKKKTNFYDYSDYDAESVIFDFLHP